MAHKILTSPTSGADNTQLYGTDWNKLINNLTGVSSSDPFTLNVDHHTFKHSTTNTSGDILVNDGTRYSRGGNARLKTNTGSAGTTLDITPTITNVADTVDRGNLRLHNVDDATNDEYLQLKADGTAGYAIEVVKTGTGSYRTLNLGNGGISALAIDATGIVYLSGATAVINADNKCWTYNPAFSFPYILRTSAITASRSITYPLLTSNDTFVFQKHHVPLISPERALTGLAIPSTSVTSASLMSINGALEGLTQTAAGTSTHTLDATEGLVSNYVSTATGNLNIGLTTATTANNITTPAFNPVLKARFKIDSTTSSRVYIGFMDGAVAASDTPLGSAISGVLFGFSSADTEFSVRHNDNSGTAITTAMTGITKDANWHTVTISLTTSDAVVVLDDGAGEKTKTITTAADRPGNTQALGVTCTGQTTTTTARTFSLKYVNFSADK